MELSNIICDLRKYNDDIGLTHADSINVLKRG